MISSQWLASCWPAGGIWRRIVTLAFENLFVAITGHRHQAIIETFNERSYPANFIFLSFPRV